MSTIKTMLKAIREVVLLLSPANALIESMMRYDFKIGDQRQTSMQMCFAYIAAWPLLLAAFLIAVDPFKNSWSLTRLLTDDNSFLYFLLDGHTQTMLIFFFTFFVAEWLIRSEQVLVVVLLYFLNRGELHVHLAITATLGIYLSRICYQWWAVFDLSGRSRFIWNRVNQIQFACWLAAAAFSMFALDYMTGNRFFEYNGLLTRLNFVMAMLVMLFAGTQFFLILWGHFYFNRPLDPSALPISYSTARWVLRFKLSGHLKDDLSRTVEQQIQKSNIRLNELATLKQEAPLVDLNHLQYALRAEIDYLKEARTRISQI
jgi:hypothetical protein